jgi:hypothetical protein
MGEAEEEDAIEQAGARGAEDAGERSDPEDGRTGAVALLQKKADEAVEKNLSRIVDCIVDNIIEKHLPSVKLLFEVAARYRVEGAVPKEDFRSFAEVLWKEVQEQERETGNRK